MCKTLCVSLDTTSVPQAKGRVERFFDTLQSPLASELHFSISKLLKKQIFIYKPLLKILIISFFKLT